MFAFTRFEDSPIRWLRAATLVVIATLCLGSLAELPVVSLPPQWERFRPLWVIPAFACYGYLYFRNTAIFPAREAWQVRFLVTQFLLSLPFESDLTVVTITTIPLVLERRLWKRWCIWTMAAVFLTFALRIGLNLQQHWQQKPANISWGQIAASVAAGFLSIVAWHLFAFLAAVLIVNVDRDRRRLTQLNAELRGSQVLLMESGRIAERLRISRELHDSLGHHLTSLSLQLEVAEHLPDDQLRPPLKQARFIAKLVMADIREAVSEWRAETSTALPDALQSLTSAFAGSQLVLDVGTEIPATPPTVTHALFRCAQEAVTNAMRHAGPSTITVRLGHDAGILRLTVEDDGRGAAEIRPGNGLSGLRSRVEEIGGKVSFDTALGKGFRMEVEVPLL